MLGTGVMVGLPGQTLHDLAGDVMFFRDIKADMIGEPLSQEIRDIRMWKGLRV